MLMTNDRYYFCSGELSALCQDLVRSQSILRLDVHWENRYLHEQLCSYREEGLNIKMVLKVLMNVETLGQHGTHRDTGNAQRVIGELKNHFWSFIWGI